MPFCKLCTCGKQIDFEQRMSYPDNCPSCGRRLIDFRTYDLNDPQVIEFLKNRSATTANQAPIAPQVTNPVVEKKSKYAIRLSNGKEIEIPEEGCIIGRTETGAEELAEFPSVSRQHLRVMPKRNIGVLIEDISTYGTLVDGQRISKNVPTRVTDGAKITLCNLETVLVVREDNNS